MADLRTFGTAMNVIEEEQAAKKSSIGVILLAITAVIIAALISLITFHFGSSKGRGSQG